MELTRGANSIIGPQASLSSIAVGVSWQGSGDFDVCAIGLHDGRVLNDDWFVFFNQLVSPGQSIILRQPPEPDPWVTDRAQVFLNLEELPDEIDRVALILATVSAPSLAPVSDLVTRVLNLGTGAQEVSFACQETWTQERCMILGEVYRHRENWKFRAVAQGYADLGGLARDFGVNIG